MNEQLELLKRKHLEDITSFRALVTIREQHIEALLVENAELKKRVEMLERWVGDEK